MKAIVQYRYGSTDVLRYEEVEQPVPAAGEVLVRVLAAGINAYDWHVMRGDPYLARLVAPQQFGFGGPKNRIRGRDFAGRVEAVGPAVTRFRPGDEVYGDLGESDGAFAEFACVPQDGVELKPANLTFAQAAAVPLAGATALQALKDVAPGQHVAINGASGGVGTFAVQIAKARGAEVTGVCSTRNVDLVRSLGADHVVDYTSDDFTLGRYDLVFDLVGNRSLRALRGALKPSGTLLLAGGGVSNGGSVFGPMGLIIKGQVVSKFVRDRVVVFVARQNRETLVALRELIESGQVEPVVDRTFPLSDTAEAIRYVEVEHARAKVVVTV
ncbi:NAD(P)-dependent alcohol dehydrogenase [Lentzea tibetensis]|uniref:NAD(P)-dependent alcohol dehydrogenase n=1 Tax=Lentzea tibetensis TaxID=2591470 RepID=A0A563F2N0_9PSEU|nr:NAD(P)-dependent alcohol dehydrogenase [Lentzea tibetensis]TWP54072.1 NAD(P)-dependent alcohol dehydrogenase [Lentzea tibetensis]